MFVASSLFLGSEEIVEVVEEVEDAAALDPADLDTGLHLTVISLRSLSEEPRHPNCSSDTRSKDDGSSRRVASIQLKINCCLLGEM